ncbi:MAG: cell division protein ZipA C-terminal FtsZ-binding domain-containing protein [Candidatus Berkiellales bacterium]
MQTDLRLLLFIIGIVLGAYLIFVGYQRHRYNRAQQQRHEAFQQTVLENIHTKHHPATEHGKVELNFEEQTEILGENRLHEANEDRFVEDPLMEAPLIEDPIVEEPKQRNQEPAIFDIISLSIQCKQPDGFAGKMLLSALKANEFYYGERNIFHRHVNDNPTFPILISLASLTKPGDFNRHKMQNEFFPGIVLWTPLTGDHHDSANFEKLLSSAKQLSTALNGVLCDEKRKPLSMQTITAYRERIKNTQKTAG